MPVENLLFVDTNIWLDFYRARNEVGLRLLGHAEAIAERLIVTYQLESEFKTNRQAAILEGMRELKAPQQIPRPGIFSDAKATQVMTKSLKEAEKRAANLRGRLVRALENPATYDPVYKVCQRIFHKKDDIALTRDNRVRHVIRRKAFRRFLHGCPPRKRSDTSIGDAFNWEWIVHCAILRKAGVVIVTRDSDYGATVGSKSYVNDHLRQEFSERVSKKRSLLLYSRLSDALKHFAIDVSPQEEEAEKELLSNVAPRTVVFGSPSPSGINVAPARLSLANLMGQPGSPLIVNPQYIAYGPPGTTVLDLGEGLTPMGNMLFYQGISPVAANSLIDVSGAKLSDAAPGTIKTESIADRGAQVGSRKRSAEEGTEHSATTRERGQTRSTK